MIGIAASALRFLTAIPTAALIGVGATALAPASFAAVLGRMRHLQRAMDLLAVLLQDERVFLDEAVLEGHFGEGGRCEHEQVLA